MPAIGDIAWPFAVNWVDPVRLTLSFKTEIILSRSGKEQRRALRHTPRKSIEFSSLVNLVDLQTFRALMDNHQNAPMILPDPTREVALSAAAPDAAYQVSVVPIPDWAAVGAAVFLTDGDRVEMKIIDSVAAPYVHFTTPSLAWPKSARLSPGLEGMLEGEIQTTQLTDTTATAAIRYNVRPASEPARALGAAAISLNGRAILSLLPNWRDNIGITYAYPSENVDYDRGEIATFRPVKFGTQIFRASYLGATADEIQEIQRWFERAKGRQGEFYLPSGLADIAPKVPMVSGSSTILVAGRRLFDAYATNTVQRALEVLMRSGDRIYRAITNIAVAGEDTLITVNTPWPTLVAVSPISRVSWMPACRFASDELTFEYETNSVAQTVPAIQTIEDLPAE
jgi:hypothetical protein